MKKDFRFAVMQVTFRADEILNLPLAFRDLKELGLDVIKIQPKGQRSLKIRVVLRRPGISRKCAVSATFIKLQNYFGDAVVETTFSKDKL